MRRDSTTGWPCSARTAASIRADKLVYLTDSRGVTDQAGEVLDAMTADEVDELLKGAEWLSPDIRRYLPCTVRATRAGVGAPRARLGAGRSVTLTVRGLPAGTTAVALNVTATGPTASGYLSAYPGGVARPRTSNLNFVAGQSIANLVVVKLGAGNKVTFFNAGGTVNLTADIVGYYSRPTA